LEDAPDFVSRSISNKTTKLLFIDLVSYELSVTAYTLRMSSNLPPKLTNFFLFGKYNEGSWKIIDTVKNCEGLDAPGASKTFHLNDKSRPMRHIALLQAGNVSFDVCNIELYGDLNLI